MPIYMDRHDVSESVTAENVACLHREDLKIQDQFGCRGLTYWFDEKRSTAFCLIEAPDEQAIQEMHKYAHGEVPHRIIEVDAHIVESFLGRIEDPEKSQNTELNIINDPAFRTVMIIMIKPTSLAYRHSAQYTSALDNFNDAVFNLVHNHGGNLVQQNRNHFLVSFKSVTQAVQAAFAIQILFSEFIQDIKTDKPLLKIGLSAGVPVTDRNSFFEDSIKLAERMGRVLRGEIIVSAEVKELYESENLKSFSDEEGLFVLTRADEIFLTQLMDYTDSYWSDTNLKVDDFGKPLGYSKSRFYRKVVELTGDSPNVFIKEYRLNEALALLNKNNRNVSEVAFETGFSSPSYFSKCFQKRWGLPPSDYIPV